jgi:hypothetical protein
MYIHVSKNPGLSLADYDRVRAHMGEEPVKGQQSHWVGEADGALTTVDVWDSQADADRFAGDRLFPAFAAVGVHPSPDAVIFAFTPAER